jgi:hypothetical protein
MGDLVHGVSPERQFSCRGYARAARRLNGKVNKVNFMNKK